MSAASGCDCPCETPVVTMVPGTAGTPGVDGADGANGISAFSVLTAALTIPAVDANVTASVGVSSWASIGQILFLSDGTDFGHFQVVSVPNSTSVQLKFLGYPGDAAAAAIIGISGTVSPAGVLSALAAALPTALTDNSTGTASNTIAAGVGVQTLAFYIEAASIANGDVLTNYVPGYRFKILKFDARCAKVVSTGAKTAALNLEIDSTDVTGGVVTVAGTYAIGAAQAGTAVTAANVGTALQSFSIEASAVTAFIEGAFWLIISVQNLDGADAVASLSDHVNDVLTSLA